MNEGRKVGWKEGRKEGIQEGMEGRKEGMEGRKQMKGLKEERTEDKRSTSDWTSDAPRPTRLQLGGVDVPEIEELANDAKRKTTEKKLQNKRLARREAIELAHETSLARTRRKEVEREARLLREKRFIIFFIFFTS